MAAIEDYARLRATHSRGAFLAELGGGGVLVRLDERGGKEDPTPWAFLATSTAVQTRGDPRFDPSWSEKVMFSPEQHAPMEFDDFGESDSAFASSSEATQNLPPPASVPDARGAASVSVLPVTLGSGRVVTLGRSVKSDVCVDERSISRVHAEFQAGKSAFALKDKASSQGSRINGKRLSPGHTQELRSGDVIEFGDVKFLYLSADAFWERVDVFMD